MAICCKCGVTFTKTRDKSYRCPRCKSEYNRDHYEKNKANYIARSTARKRRALEAICVRLLEHFSGHPCIDCGERDPVVLEFDHIRDKEKDVGRMISEGFSWIAISEEIKKCEVRCANCHRRITARRAGWARYRLSE